MDEVKRYIRRVLDEVATNRGSVWQAAAVYAVGGAVLAAGSCLFAALVDARMRGDYRGVLRGVVGFAVAMGIVGAVVHAWKRDVQPRLRVSVRPHHIVKAVLVAAAAALIAVFWWPYPGAVPAHHDRLATIHHVRVVALLLVATLFINPGPLLFARNPNTVQVRRVAGGLACLSVVAFVVKSMADDLGSYAAVRGFFEEILRLFPAYPVRAAPYAALLLLAVISMFRVAVGLRGPFPRDPMELGKAVLGLAVWGCLWLWGVFVPPSWDWLDFGPDYVLSFSPDALNFGLTSLYLLSVVENIGWIALMLYRPDLGGRGPVQEDIERQKKRW